MPHIFQEGAYVPLPSQEAMAKTIGKGGNGVVGYIYHGGREFAVKETGLRQEELETWSSVNHRNVIDICAVVEGDWDLACPGARRCFQMMPRVTGKSINVAPIGLISECHDISLCLKLWTMFVGIYSLVHPMHNSAAY